MRSGKLWVELLDVMAGLTDDLEVTDHGVLNQLGVHERLFVHVLGIAANAFDGLCDEQPKDTHLARHDAGGIEAFAAKTLQVASWSLHCHLVNSNA